MIAIVRDDDEGQSVRELAIAILQEMGPDAKPAVPALKQLLESENKSPLYEAASKALETIAR